MKCIEYSLGAETILTLSVECLLIKPLSWTFIAAAANMTWMALISMVVFIASYSIGIGPIAWLLVGEILPLRARGKAAGLSTAFNLFLVFVITSSFNSMLVSLISAGTSDSRDSLIFWRHSCFFF